jgi:hypothetical protein
MGVLVAESWQKLMPTVRYFLAIKEGFFANISDFT